MVLFLHGFPDNVQTFDAQLMAVANAGYRGVAVSLRGYEPLSLPPDNDYSQTTLAADVVAVIKELGEERVHLVGHDWGAGIAYTAAAVAPEMLRSLITIALPHPGRFINDMHRHPRQLKLSWYIMFFQLTGIADYFVQRNDYQFIRNRWRDWSPNWTVPEPLISQVLEDLKQPGVMNAALRYYRTAVSLGAFTPGARAAANFKVKVPCLAISGADDGCIDSSVFEKMMYEEDFPMGLEFHRMEGVGHFPHLEKPDDVNKLILSWVNQH